MTLAVDYSFARYTAAELADAGVDVVFRYLRGEGKAITAAELHTLLSGGRQVVICDEMLSTTATSGAAGGTTRAGAINAALSALTAALVAMGSPYRTPATTPVYAAADAEYEALTTPLAHFGAIAAVRGVGACGIYGEGELCEDARARGFVAFTWQSAGRSFPGNASALPTTDVVQSTTKPPLATTDLDLIELPGDFGQLPRPTTAAPATVIPPATKGGADVLIIRTATKGPAFLLSGGKAVGFSGGATMAELVAAGVGVAQITTPAEFTALLKGFTA